MRIAPWLLVACGAPDGDGDGWDRRLDCDDEDAAVHPSAAERCNGRDDNCDGQADIGALDAVPWFMDGDGDGAGSATSFVLACDPPGGFLPDALDCNDLDNTVHPDAIERCNGRDDDCDGETDEEAAGVVPHYPDTDGDGHGDPSAPDLSCVPPAGTVSLPDDCDDTSPAIHPGAIELCDGADQDCDTLVDEEAADATLWYPDIDGDGYGFLAVEVRSCTAPPGYIPEGTDCDDFDPANHPGADERCDGVDNNCDAVVDGAQAIDPSTWYRDIDSDGFGSASSIVACDAPDDYVSWPGDCNDADAEASPLSPEICGNEIDDDCNGLVDECGGGAPVSTWSIDDITVATWTATPDDHLDTVVMGDLDGDGLSDLVMGAPFADGSSSDAGAVWLAYGTSTPTGDNPVAALPSFSGAAANDRLTENTLLSTVGDLDGDGLEEVMAGAFEGDGSAGSDAGLAALLYGSTVREAGAQNLSAFDAIFSGSVANARVGHGLAGLGDIDGDGLDDAAFADSRNPSFDGTVYLLFGSATRALGALPAEDLPQVVGETSDGLGLERGVTGADIDGDGLSDAVMAAAFQTHRLLVMYGDGVRPTTVDAADLPEVIDSLGQVGTDFGRLLRTAGDLNGDGYSDVVVTDITYTSAGGSGSGQAWLIGGGERLSGTVDLSDVAFATIEGVSLGGYCGWDAGGIGDFSGDGADDLAVSALYWAGSFVEAGGVGVFHGTLSGSVRFDDADWLIEGGSGQSFLGYSLDAGDVDGDGWNDLALAGAAAAGGRGRVYLILGGTL